MYRGRDLSATTDLCALVGVSANDGSRLDAWFWKPREVMQLHATRDRAPYNGWSREGYTADAPDKFLTVSPGRSVDYELIVRRVMALDKRFRIKGIAFERWGIEVLMKELDRKRDGKGKGVSVGVALGGRSNVK